VSGDVTGFAVTPDELGALDGSLDAAAATARAAVDRLRREGAALLSDGWHGAAANAFRLGWQEWLDGAGLVLAALDELAGLVGAAGESYASTDGGVRASFAGAGS
jgi:WXG100 family type VII secretion target